MFKNFTKIDDVHIISTKNVFHGGDKKNTLKCSLTNCVHTEMLQIQCNSF